MWMWNWKHKHSKLTSVKLTLSNTRERGLVGNTNLTSNGRKLKFKHIRFQYLRYHTQRWQSDGNFDQNLPSGRRTHCNSSSLFNMESVTDKLHITGPITFLDRSEVQSRVFFSLSIKRIMSQFWGSEFGIWNMSWCRLFSESIQIISIQNRTVSVIIFIF